MGILANGLANFRRMFAQDDIALPSGRATSGKFTKETATSASDPWSSRRFMGGFLTNGLDPDNPILSRETSDDGLYQYPYGIYDEMENKDTQITAAKQLRIDSVLDGTMSIQPFDESKQAKTLADWATWAVNMIGHRGGDDWRDVTGAMLNSVWRGFQVSELIWGVNNFEGSEYWIFDQINPKHQRRFTFNIQDELMMFTDIGNPVAVPDGKFVITKLYPDHDTPWGTPLLNKLYYLFKFKKAVTFYWIMYCEKYGMPLPVGGRDPGYQGSGDDDTAFENALAGIMQDNWIYKQEGQTLEFAEFARHDSATLYQDFMTMANREISKVALGATMIMEESSVGTQGMAEVLQKRFTSKVNADSLAVAREWNRSIIRPLIEINFGEKALEIAPTLFLTVKEETDILAEAQTAAILAGQLNLKLSAKDLYEMSGRTEPTSEDDTVEGSASEPMEIEPESEAEAEAVALRASEYWEQFPS